VETAIIDQRPPFKRQTNALTQLSRQTYKKPALVRNQAIHSMTPNNRRGSQVPPVRR
jgi:hypothetical protein